MAYDYDGSPGGYNVGPTQISPTGSTGNTDWPYYVLCAGIEHSVIQTDIGRWLGNDAVVRKALFQGAEVYLYKGYRPLTNAMINSLREDTTKWENERTSGYSRQPDFHSSRTFYDRVHARDPPRSTRQPAPETIARYPPPDPSGYPGQLPAAPGYGEHPQFGAAHVGRGGYHYPDPVQQERPERRERRSRTNRTAERDPRYAYDEATGQPYYDLITRQYLEPAVPNQVQDQVPRTLNPEASASGVAPVRYAYTTGPSADAHYYPTHDARGYGGPSSDEE